MPETFQDTIRGLSEADRVSLQSAGEVSQTAQLYHNLASQNAIPTAEVVSDANSMRVVQLGEEIKNRWRSSGLEWLSQRAVSPVFGPLMMRSGATFPLAVRLYTATLLLALFVKNNSSVAMPSPFLILALTYNMCLFADKPSTESSAASQSPDAHRKQREGEHKSCPTLILRGRPP